MSMPKPKLNEINKSEEIRQMAGYLDALVEIVQKIKMDWVENTDRGDMPPTLFVERDDKCVAIVMAPNIDRDLGLKAAEMCRRGFRASALTLVTDSHVRMESTEGKTLEEAKDQSEFLKNYKHGDMQRMCDEEGACERGEIADCLVCIRIDDQSKKKMWAMPYAYHGKQGGYPFKWMPDHPAAKLFSKVAESDAGLEGVIVESLEEIMKLPSMLDDATNEEMQALKEAAEVNGLDDPNRQLYHVGRAMLRVLEEQGFQVLDLQPHPDTGKPEPIMPLEQSVSLRDIIPENISPQIGKLLHEHGDNADLEQELLDLLKPHQEAININADKFDIPHRHVKVEIIAKGIVRSFKGVKEQKARQPKPPYKVKVWSGDKSKYLGEGTYVGDVPVFFIATPDGSIRSAANAEERPSEEMLAQIGGELVEAGDNPKIIMDEPIDESGRTVVYGCQVWWSPAEHEHHEGCGCAHD